MEGHCSTGQSPRWAVVPMEEEEEYSVEMSVNFNRTVSFNSRDILLYFSKTAFFNLSFI